MARFNPNTPIATDTPVITVDAGLSPGRYTFRLVVVDDEGNQSAPDEAVVTILSRQIEFSGGTFERITPVTPISFTRPRSSGLTVPRPPRRRPGGG